MSLFSLPLSERLECLEDLLSCCGQFNGWIYDEKGELIKTNSPHLMLHKIFVSSGCMDVLLKHAGEHREPLIMSIPYGLNWGAAFEYESGKLKAIHVLGPVSATDVSYDAIRKALQNSRITPSWRPKLIDVLQKIPIVPTIDLMHYTLMLHYCVTGEQLTNADIAFKEPGIRKDAPEEPAETDRMNTYMTEQALMRMVSEGDLNYKSIFHRASFASKGVHAGKMGSLEQVRVSQIVFISLCTRAAIQGGLSPELAYSRGDAYIQDIMKCRTIADAANIGHTMYDEFIQLVHKKRTNPQYSPQIRNCCDYIELHAEEKLRLSDIAKRIGYVEYYLSRKFKAETGYNINDYIKTVKIERAKTLLLSTDLSIQDICDRLQFGSRSFFAETFKEITGIPPAAFREQNRH